MHKYLYDIRRIEKNIPSSIFFLITYKSNLLNNKNSLVQDFFIHQSHFSFFLSLSFPFSNFFSFVKEIPRHLPRPTNPCPKNDRRLVLLSAYTYVVQFDARPELEKEGLEGVCVCALVKVHASSYLSRVLMRTEAGFSPLFLGFASFHVSIPPRLALSSRPLFHPSCSLPRPARAWCCARARPLVCFGSPSVECVERERRAYVK